MEISDDQLDKMIYHLDSFLNLMGFGREYNKIVLLIQSLNIPEEKKKNFEKYYNAYRFIK
jgi:hypothetical protein